MLISMNWISDFVDLTGLDKMALIRQFSLSTAEVENEIFHKGADLSGVVAAQIVSVENHPESHKLHLLKVDAGDGQLTDVVCGAPNVQLGMKTAFAKVGAQLGDITISPRKLAGYTSYGMCCSEKEIGISDDNSGIMVIPEDVPCGTDLKALYPIDDIIFEVDNKSLTNRPDLWGHYGMAREFSTLSGRPLKALPVADLAAYNNLPAIDMKIEDPLCQRYSCLRVENINRHVSPMAMRIRLNYCGMRDINFLADLTNYLMLEMGQPMHAFDFSCVDGGRIVVRTAREGEVIQTLDGNDRKLTPNMLCICDEHKPVCVAGVMGGANSEIVGDTAMVLFESANFNGVSVRRTAAALGMRTDASARYEKGLDSMNTMKAVQRACELVELLGCGEVVDGVMDVIAKDKAPTVVKLEPEKINALLGTDLPESLMREILLSLGFELSGDDILVPSWRGDVEHYSDIAEEVARFYGYNNIPCTLMRGETTRGGFSEQQLFDRALGETCRTLGYDEIITYSFISPSYYDKIRMPKDAPLRKSLKILNPLGEDTSIMRTTILPSMLEIITRNYNYRNKAVRLYELGKIYLPREDGLADEPKILSLGAYGDGMDFFTLKGGIEAILRACRIKDVRFEACTDNASYHPGRCAKVYAGDVELGVFGQIHPLVAATYGVDAEIYAAELRFDALYSVRGGIPVYQPLPKFPAVTRDIAVVCAESVTVGALEDCIRRGAKGLLKKVELFDIYRGIGVAPGSKSVAFSLTLRADDRSLTGEEADEDVKSILALLEAELGAKLR